MLAMLTPSSGSDYLRCLRDSNLIDRGRLDQLTAELGSRLRLAPTPEQLADYLVDRGILTRFQSDRVLKGAAQGLVYGPFELQDVVGHGSTGATYRARHRADGQPYALKLLPRRSMWNVRLAKRYQRAFEQFVHPAVVPLADVGTAGSQHYLAWPLVKGETLAQLVARNGPLPSATVVRYAMQIADGLAACARNGLFHGLVSAGNVLIGPDGQARVLDGGIGAILASTREDEASMINTLGQASLMTSGLDCASPESILEPERRSAAGDQYSLGCVLYYALAARYPFSGSATERIRAHQLEQAEPLRRLNPAVQAELADVVHRLLQKVPTDRFSDFETLLDHLRPLAEASALIPVVPAPEPWPVPVVVLSVTEAAADEPATAVAAFAGENGESPSEFPRLLTMVVGMVALGVVCGFAVGRWLLR